MATPKSASPTILLVSTSANKMSSLQIDDQGNGTLLHTVENVADPLPVTVANDKHSTITTDWIMRHNKYPDLVYALTSFDLKAKAVLTTFRLYKCGTLERLTACPSGGYQASHAALNPSGSSLAVAHLHGGTVSFFNVQDNVGCVGPPVRIVRLPVIYPYNLLQPHLSTTGLSVPAALGVSFSPEGDYVSVAEPSQHAIVTYRCDAQTGRLQTMEAYHAIKGLPRSNSAFSYVRAKTDFDRDITWCQSLAIMGGAEFGPKLRRVAVNPNNGEFLYALHEQTNYISVYALENSGMILPKCLQEIKVADLNTFNGSPKLCAGTAQTACMEMQIYFDHLVVSIDSTSSSECGIRMLHFVDDGARLELGQFIPTRVPVHHFMRDEDDVTLWVGFQSDYMPFVQKYQKKGRGYQYKSDYDPTEDEYSFVGRATVQCPVQCLLTVTQDKLPVKPEEPEDQKLAAVNRGVGSSAPAPAPTENKAVRKAKLRAAFLKRDTDGSGYLEPHEVAQVLESMGELCSPEDVKEFMDEADKDNDGKLDFDEFFTFADRTYKQSLTPEMIQRRKLATIFNSNDADGSGHLDAQEISEVLAEMGKPTSPAEITEFMLTIDADGDGRIDFQEFYAFCTRSSDPKEVERNKLRAAFKKKDSDGSGTLDADEIAKVLAGMGQPASPKDVAEFMATRDKDGDGLISFDEFYEYATRKLTPEEKQRQKLRAAFDKKDVDDSGFLDASEVAQVMSSMGQRTSAKEIQHFMDQIDSDGDGQVDFEEFYAFATGQTTVQRQTPKLSPEEIKRQRLKAAFDRKDDDGSGFLEADEVAQVLKTLGQKVTAASIKTFMQEMDQDGDGKIDFDEFYAFATGQTPKEALSKKEKQKRRKLKTAFDQKDADGSGYLDVEEVAEVLQGMGQKVTRASVQEFMQTMDQDGDGRVDFEEFYTFATGKTPGPSAADAAAGATKKKKAPKPKKGSAEEAKRKKLKKAFDAKDDDKSGYLDASEIAEVLASTGEPCDRKSVARFMKQMDKDGDGQIDFEEFYAFATGAFQQEQEDGPPAELRSSKTGIPPPARPPNPFAASTGDIHKVRKARFRASFQEKDTNGSGYLDSNEVAALLESMGEPCSAKDVLEFMKHADTNQDGKLDFEEFYAFATAGQKRKSPSSSGRGSKQSSRRTTGGVAFSNLDEGSDAGSLASSVEDDPETAKLRAAFNKQDRDGSGTLEEEEIIKLLDSLGHPTTSKDVAKFIRAVDADGDGMLDFDEFCVFASRKMGSKSSKSKSKRSSRSRRSGEDSKLRAAFDKGDKDRSGFLEEGELIKSLASLGHVVSRKEVADYVQAIDQDGDGKIDFDEFCVFASRCAKKSKQRGSRPSSRSQRSKSVAVLKDCDMLDGPDLSDPKVKKYKAAFDKKDKDGSGYLDLREMGKLLASMGQHADEEELQAFVKSIDKDGDGQIDFAEFLAFAEKNEKSKSRSRR